MAKDYYQILGVSKTASKDDLKKAFRKLAHEYHPDKKTGNEAKFKEVNEAYTILSDDQKRAQYDTYGQTFNGGNPGGGTGGFNASDFDFSGFQNAQGFDFDLGDIFGDFFGGGSRGGAHGRQRRGSDITIDIELTFAESIFGTEKKIVLTKSSLCDHCKGSGGEPGGKMKTCPTCSGKGSIRETRKSILGSFVSERICPECEGLGQVPETKCKECRGAGIIRKQTEFTVKVPSGINSGEVLRLSGSGEAIKGGSPGDLYIRLHVRPHSTFKKDGHNLVTNLHVKLSDALLGSNQSIQTLDGSITLTIPTGVTFGEILRVKAKGVPTDRGKRGDLLVHIIIDLPKKLSKESRKAIEELKREGI